MNTKLQPQEEEEVRGGIEIKEEIVRNNEEKREKEDMKIQVNTDLTSPNAQELYGAVVFNSISFQDHSKIQTITPTESLVDFPLHPDLSECIHPPKQTQEQLKEEVSTLREQNLYLRQELHELKAIYQQITNSHQTQQLAYNNEDINRLIEENHKMQEENRNLVNRLDYIGKQREESQRDMVELGRANQELYKRVVALTNQLERERKGSRNVLEQAETHHSNQIEQYRQRIDELTQGIAQIHEQNNELASLLQQSKEEIEKERIANGKLQEQCQILINDVQELRQYIQNLQAADNRQEIEELKQLIQLKQQQIDEMFAENQIIDQERVSFIEDCTTLKDLYQQQLQKVQAAEEAIFRLTQQLQSAKMQLNTSQKHQNLLPSSLYNHPQPIMNSQKHSNPLKCSASSSNRLNLLSSSLPRKGTMHELRRLIKQIGKIELQNKISSLLHELYMEAEYRQRTNLKMQEIIVQQQTTINRLQSLYPNVQEMRKDGLRPNEITQLQDSILRYERLLLLADEERLRLIQELGVLQRQNYQVRVELANSQLDNQTEQLIEQLTLQLEQEKYSHRTLEEENEELRDELVAVERELQEKNERIRLLSLNLTKREQSRQAAHN